MALHVTLITAELADGTVHDQVRVTAADRLKLERAGRQRNWQVGSADSTFITTQLYFLAWAALTRTGALDAGTSFEDFTDRLLVDVHSERGEADLGDPTRPAPTAG